MTATLNSCVSKLSNLATNAYQTVSAGLRSTPACYAKKSVIRAERITAVSLIALGFITALHSPLVGPAATTVGTGMIIAGMTITGLSLLQEAIGEAKNCKNAKLTRIFAGINFLCPHPVTWIIGALAWASSDKQNEIPGERRHTSHKSISIKIEL